MDSGLHERIFSFQTSDASNQRNCVHSGEGGWKHFIRSACPQGEQHRKNQRRAGKPKGSPLPSPGEKAYPIGLSHWAFANCPPPPSLSPIQISFQEPQPSRMWTLLPLKWRLHFGYSWHRGRPHAILVLKKGMQNTNSFKLMLLGSTVET